MVTNRENMKDVPVLSHCASADISSTVFPLSLGTTFRTRAMISSVIEVMDACYMRCLLRGSSSAATRDLHGPEIIDPTRTVDVAHKARPIRPETTKIPAGPIKPEREPKQARPDPSSVKFCRQARTHLVSVICFLTL